MSKDTETIILSDLDTNTASMVRAALINEFSGCWFYVYNDGRITASNEFGGALSEETIKELTKFSKARISVEKLSTLAKKRRQIRTAPSPGA